MALYDITLDIDVKEARTAQQLAFAVCHDNFTIRISKSGHGKITRGLDRHDFEGGWVFPRDRKITFYSGSLGEVRSNRQDVKDDISEYLGVHLRIV